MKHKIGGLAFLMVAMLILAAATVSSASANGISSPFDAPKATPTNPPPVPLPLFLALAPGSGQANNIFSFNKTLSQVSSGGVSWMPIASPAGGWVAYGYIPNAYLKANGARLGLPQPENITLMNVTTNTKETIAGQPNNVSLDAQSGQMAFTLRSFPSWSPDGKKLVWTENTIDQGASVNIELAIEQLVIYDVDTKQTRVIVAQLPPHRNIEGTTNPIISTTVWGPGGIAVQVASVGLDYGFSVYVYTPDGKLLSQTSDDTSGLGFDSSQMIWIKNGNTNMITTVNGAQLIDPLTGNLYTNPGTNELYAPKASHGLSLYFGSDAGNDASTNWMVVRDGKVVQVLTGIIITSNFGAAISPDGQQVAFMVYQGQGSSGTVSMFRKGKPYDLGVTSVNGLSWGASAWRVNLQGSDF
jgi:Tol biopolymer transport system component